MTHKPQLKIVFFGTSKFAVIVLEELKKKNLIPSLVVTTPDKPKGRGLALTPPPVKLWAQENKIKFLCPEKLDSSFASQLSSINCQLFVVASYGKILPKKILNIPKHGTLNVHPSLLPLHRGPSPIQTQVLENSRIVGVTIMLIDEKVDHGPILTQEAMPMPTPLPSSSGLEEKLALAGGKLLGETISPWVAGKILPHEQDHNRATYTKLLTKKDGFINLAESPKLNYRKIRAYDPWPETYFFIEINNDKRLRLKIIDAKLEDGKLIIKKVIPEGKKEVDYKNFLKSMR